MQKECTSNANVVESVHNDSLICLGSQGLPRNQSVWQNGHLVIAVSCHWSVMMRQRVQRAQWLPKHSLAVAHVDLNYVCCHR